MSRYAIVRLIQSGDHFAVRFDAADLTVTGVCGPLHYTDQDAPGPDYDYDTDPDTLAQWNGDAIDYGHVKDLAV